MQAWPAAADLSKTRSDNAITVNNGIECKLDGPCRCAGSFWNKHWFNWHVLPMLAPKIGNLWGKSDCAGKEPASHFLDLIWFLDGVSRDNRASSDINRPRFLQILPAVDPGH